KDKVMKTQKKQILLTLVATACLFLTSCKEVPTLPPPENADGSPRIGKEIHGYVDVIDEQGIVYGWALANDARHMSVAVQFYADGGRTNGGRLLGTIMADQRRDDVGGNYGFNFVLPASVRDGKT